MTKTLMITSKTHDNGRTRSYEEKEAYRTAIQDALEVLGVEPFEAFAITDELSL